MRHPPAPHLQNERSFSSPDGLLSRERAGTPPASSPYGASPVPKVRLLFGEGEAIGLGAAEVVRTTGPPEKIAAAVERLIGQA